VYYPTRYIFYSPLHSVVYLLVRIIRSPFYDSKIVTFSFIFSTIFF
jgi:hypothetical protein